MTDNHRRTAAQPEEQRMSENNATTTAIPARGDIDPDALLDLMRRLRPMPYGQVIVTTVAIEAQLRAATIPSDSPPNHLLGLPIEAYVSLDGAKARALELRRGGHQPILVVDEVV